MHTVISHASQFRDAFHAVGRGTQFSYEALGLLFDYFEEMDDSQELDVIAICCDYAEETIEDFVSNHSIDISDCDGEDEIQEAVVDYLQEHTVVVGTLRGAVVYQQF